MSGSLTTETLYTGAQRRAAATAVRTTPAVLRWRTVPVPPTTICGNWPTARWAAMCAS